MSPERLEKIKEQFIEFWQSHDATLEDLSDYITLEDIKYMIFTIEKFLGR